MTYRPPITPFWKNISFMIVIIFGTGSLLFSILCFIQKTEKNSFKKDSAKGILVQKTDLHRGDFLLVIQDDNKISEHILSGYDLFYDKFFIGDSIVKLNDSFEFNIYKKDSSNKYLYKYTVGYP